MNQRYPQAFIVGDGTHLVIPGFVNAHSHGRGISTLRRGVEDNFLELRLLEMRLISSAPDIYWDTLLSCIRQLKSGITTTMHVDSYYAGTKDTYENKLKNVISAYKDSGLRFSIALGIRDQNNYVYQNDSNFFENVPKEIRDVIIKWPTPALKAKEYFEIFEQLSQIFKEVSLQFGPVNPVWCSVSLLSTLYDQAKRHGIKIHIHLLETFYQKAYAFEKYGKSFVAWLVENEFLSPNVSCAHCVWITEDDITLLKKSGVTVITNPSSNLRLRSGLAPVREIYLAGIPLALGIDSLGFNDDEDMFQEIRLAKLLYSPPGIEQQTIRPEVILQWATECGSKVVGLDNIGTLGLGNKADLVMINTDIFDKTDMKNINDIAMYVSQISSKSSVDIVMVGGQILVKGGKYMLRDEVEIERKAYNSLRRVRSVNSSIMTKTKDFIECFYRDYPLEGDPFYFLNARQ
ncbi:MAG: amidohydrolase family protein [Candidatus Heimdallarchaeaceae archaeon]